MNRTWIGCVVIAAVALGVILPVGSRAWAADMPAAGAKDLVSLDIRDIDVKAAIQALFRNSDRNYSIEASVSGTVPAMSIKDAPFETALKTLAKSTGLVWRRDTDGIYIISKKPETTPVVDRPVDPGSSQLIVDQPITEETIIDKVPLNFSSATEILAAMSGDTSRLYGGSSQWGGGYGGTMGGVGMGSYGGYGGYGGYPGYGGFGGSGGYGSSGGYGGYGGYGGSGGYGGYGGYGSYTGSTGYIR